MTWFTKKWDTRFDDDLPDSWAEPQVVRVGGSDDAEQAFALMESCPRHTFVLPMTDIDLKWMADWFPFNNQAPPNVIPAALVADQAEADMRIPLLLQIPARHRLVLAEGLRGPVNLIDIACEMIDVTSMADDRRRFAPAFNRGIHGLIASGGTDPMHPDWVRSLRDQCDAAGVAFRFDGWGDWKQCDSPGDWYGTDPSEYYIKCMWPCGSTFGPVEGEPFSPNAAAMSFARVGHSASGRLLDGVRHDALPWDKEGGR